MKEHLLYHTRLTLAFHNLMECEKYGKLLIKNSVGELGSETRTVYDALLISFFVSYGRAFKQSNTTVKEYTPKIRIRFNEFIKSEKNKLSIEEQKLHDYFITQRDQIFAHSDANALGLMVNKMFDSYWYIGDNITKQYSNKTIEKLLKICYHFSSKILDEKNLIEEKYPEAFDGV